MAVTHFECRLLALNFICVNMIGPERVEPRGLARVHHPLGTFFLIFAEPEKNLKKQALDGS